jgi:alkylation response protein AidB-like acyl-CoA dehydrogenase
MLAADAAAGAGDDRDLSRQIRHVVENTCVDFTLTPEQELIRDSAREFCDREIVPHAREWDRSERMDEGIVAKLAEIGFLGCALPEEYGGMGLDTVSYCLVMEELGRADSSVRGIVSVNNGLAGKTIAKWGTEAQKQEWLPQLASGQALGCYGLTEPGSGSDPASLMTRAERDGGDWLISGSKIFITLGSWAGVALVFARSGGEGARGITCFLVPTGSEGFSARKIDGKLGLRAQDTAELFFDGVRVRDSARLGDEGAGFKVAMSALDNGRISLAAGAVGVAQACVDASVAYASERKQFGKPLAPFQLIQELIADMAVETEAARLLAWRAAALADAGASYTLAASQAKYYASEVAVRAANAALQAHGGYGYVDEFPVARYLRDARVLTLYEGTSQIQKLLIGRALTGESAFV